MREWVTAAARAASAKRGEDTIVLEVCDILAITDAFVITNGTNRRQVLTIADEVEAQVKAAGGPGPLRVEGRSATEIFGSPDDLKLRSCATLFACVLPPDSVFDRLLKKYYRGGGDEKTLQLLGTAPDVR